MTVPSGAGEPAPEPAARGRFDMIVERISAALALTGGAILVAVSITVTAGVVGRWLFGREITGAFEIVQIGVAIAAFLFLPICQLHGQNITVDTFTDRAPARLRGGLDALSAFAYGVIALALAWRLAIGARETIGSGMVSSMLQLPFGWAMAVGAAALAFLAIVSLVVGLRHLRVAPR